MSPHIILFLAIALEPPVATSYSIDEKSVDRTSIPGAKYLNQNLYSWFQKYGILCQLPTNTLHEFTPREIVGRRKALCRFETKMALS